jgi:hypothetical protein
MTRLLKHVHSTIGVVKARNEEPEPTDAKTGRRWSSYSAGKAAWSGPDWLTAGRFACVLAALIICVFPDVVFGIRTFVFRDFGFFGYPVAHYYRESFWKAEIPLWNPLNHCGLPFLAQWGTMVLYPPSLFYLVFPLWWALPVFCLGHQWLAGLGMYFLAHRWTAHRFAAAVAGLAFALNGLTLNCLMWPNYMAALGWMPFVVLFTEKAWKEGGRSILVASLIGALQMLTGAPEVIMFTWLFLTGLLLFQGELTLGWWLCTLRRFFLTVVIITCLAAAQLFPFLDLLRDSQRENELGVGHEWAMPVWGWANFLVPLFRMHRSPLGVMFQPEQGLTSSYYLGIGLLVFSMIALWKVREKKVWFLAAVALASIICAMGEAGYVHGWLSGLVPQTAFIRYPVKYLIFTAFVLPLLAAIGLRYWLQIPAEARAEAIKTLGTTSGFILCLVVGIVWFSSQFPLPDEKWSVTLGSGVTRGLLLVLIAGTLLLLTRVVKCKSYVPIHCLLLLLLWLDFVTHAPRQNPTVEPDVYAPLPPDMQMRPQPILGESRAMLSLEAEKQFFIFGPTNVVEDYFGRRLGLSRNSNLLEGIPKVGGFFSVFFREERDVQYRLYGPDGRPHAALADFLGVSQLTAKGNVAEWETQTNYMPMITAGQRAAFLNNQATLELITSTHFHPRETVYLPAKAQAVVTATNQTQVAILSRSVSAHRIQTVVSADRPCMMVVAQVFSRLWRAYVDGKPVRLWRANYAFQALEVPEGVRKVELVYEDRAFFLGAILSTITLLGCMMTGLIFIPRHRRMNSEGTGGSQGRSARIWDW